MTEISPQIRTVGVIGAGIIGSSWVTLFLSQGLKVIVSDPAPNAHEQLKGFIQKAWPSMEKLGLKPGASADNYEFVDDVANHLDRVEYVQENLPEKLELKLELYANLDAKAPHSVILASSSSALPASKFVDKATRAPERIIIGHTVNPPHLMPIVEVVPHPGTSESVTTTTIEFYRSLGKQPIRLNQECPGYVMNRLKVALCNEAYSLVIRGIVSAADLDAAMSSGMGLRWAVSGPLVTNALAGGGGPGGFRWLAEHLAPHVEVWTKDMDANRYDGGPEGLDKLSNAVGDMMEKMGGKEAEQEFARQRDDAMVDMINLKKQNTSLI